MTITREIFCKIDRWRLCAVALNDFEFQVDDAAAQVLGPIHNPTKQHLRRALANIVAGKTQCCHGWGDMSKEIDVIKACQRNPTGHRPSAFLTLK